ncbi:Peptidoglycan/LPS O-acetylase OafA/YrhL, contains acyltransferase and SGNH-hydrolase domains [Nocardioides scoriae]|uniref:Peptidoglycan/LPS O-acetylase OafA/YrhL, contains acyltransferase and SGNH-hydrolase domains n=1 Tax=Nocardioides scoriae TaxID=642780 RepID=A0A1H1QH42_9ACTN|nr:acyltransferase [Nocardioides scoriae]SDS22726.1 Peptidoglycan/LPS O-acetylase OafA/YrhL, contains acyltransferase and SGNH-hydrolase domains [Nocardioides scoriae]
MSATAGPRPPGAAETPSDPGLADLDGRVSAGAHFPVLDSLRAVGALAVLTTHTAFWAGAYTGHGVWGTLLSRLDVGVAVFFVLSGFLLARPWLASAADERPAPAAGRYLWKRALRILPVYAVTVVLALSLIADNRDRGVLDWIASLLLLDTYVHDLLPAGLTQMWSLAVEAAFYLVLPALMLLATGGRRRRVRPWAPGRVLAVLVGLVAVSLLWHLVATPALEGRVAGQPGQWLPAYLSWFACGILVALLVELRRRGRWDRWTAPLVRLGRQPGVCWAMAGALLLVSATPLAGPSMLAPATAAEGTFKHLAYAGVGLLLVLTGVFAPEGRFTRAFSHPAARHLGLVSYSLFCLHLPVLHLVMWLTGWELFDGHLLGIFVLTVVLSLVAAELAYRLVERPAMRLRSVALPTRASRTGTSTR